MFVLFTIHSSVEKICVCDTKIEDLTLLSAEYEHGATKEIHRFRYAAQYLSNPKDWCVTNEAPVIRGLIYFFNVL